MRAFVAFGGNIGDVEKNLRGALEAVAQLPGTRIRRISSLYRTAPVGPAGQPDFINGVIELQTALGPEEALEALLGIEQNLGRTREQKWGPRTVDLDLLLWGEEVLASPTLEVPHPRLHERGFVLVPFTEIAPEVRHPVLGRSVRELLGELGPTPDVRVLGRPSWIDELEGTGT